jgi:hypothetical protein
MGMQLRNKTPKRRVKAKLRDDRLAAVAVNETWAMDFMHDQLATGRKLRVLTIIDTFSRFAPALDARFSYRGEDVVATLDAVCAEVGFPRTIRVDQGSEFVSRDLDLWAYRHGVELDFSRPGKPTDNAFIEAFNGRLRAECLNTHWFLSLADAREKLEAWRRYYNEERPPRRDRQQAPDRADEPRRRIRRAIGMRPGNSSLGWSKVRARISLQKFASVHATVSNHFSTERGLSSRIPPQDQPRRCSRRVAQPPCGISASGTVLAETDSNRSASNCSGIRAGA